jgi:hypothetical protein
MGTRAIRASSAALVAATLLALFAALTLAACGGSSTSSNSPSTSPITAVTVRPTPTSDGWYLRVYNVDEVGKAYVNGALVTRVGYLDDSGWVDITKYVKKTGGRTSIRFTTYNKGSGYTWGFQVATAPDDPDSVVWTKEAGRAGEYGANGDDQKRENSMVYDKTLYLKDLPTASPAP